MTMLLLLLLMMMIHLSLESVKPWKSCRVHSPTTSCSAMHPATTAADTFYAATTAKHKSSPEAFKPFLWYRYKYNINSGIAAAAASRFLHPHVLFFQRIITFECVYLISGLSKSNVRMCTTYVSYTNNLLSDWNWKERFCCYTLFAKSRHNGAGWHQWAISAQRHATRFLTGKVQLPHLRQLHKLLTLTWKAIYYVCIQYIFYSNISIHKPHTFFMANVK